MPIIVKIPPIVGILKNFQPDKCNIWEFDSKKSLYFFTIFLVFTNS